MPESAARKHLLVDFEPAGRRVEIQPGQDLLEAARSAGVDLVSVCGGRGSCDSCRVRLMSGGLNSPTLEEQEVFEPEELEAGYRLACQSVPQTDVKVDVPAESLASTQRLQLEGQEVETSGTSVITACDLQIDKAGLGDLRSDTTRVLDALAAAGHSHLRFSPKVLRTISDVLRDNGWRVRAALRSDEVVALLPEGTQLVGLAIDVGTTKVAGYLLDLETGRTLAKTGTMNPQISYGEDVISRVAYTDAHADGRSLLQMKLMMALGKMIGELCAESGVVAAQIVEAVIVGNTAMHHLLIGLPVHQLAMAPYVPAVGESLEMHVAELGLAIAPGALVYFPPNIAGFVGADHVAVLVATDILHTNETMLALDIGTNTEITLAVGGRLLSCSCASGPAFEGAHIHDGMRAAPGAIERVRIKGGEPAVFTIGNEAPVGICGSGILDAVAEMLKAGIVDRRGSIQAGAPNVRPGSEGGLLEVVLWKAEGTGRDRDVVVTRSDVNEVLLAKGAIRAGIEVLLQEAGIGHESIDEFVVAGAFGTYLDIDSAVAVGMFPDLPRWRFRQIGNAAGTGARRMLVSARSRQIANELPARIEYVELTTHPGFTDAFMKALSL